MASCSRNICIQLISYGQLIRRSMKGVYVCVEYKLTLHYNIMQVIHITYITYITSYSYNLSFPMFFEHNISKFTMNFVSVKDRKFCNYLQISSYQRKFIKDKE